MTADTTRSGGGRRRTPPSAGQPTRPAPGTGRSSDLDLELAELFSHAARRLRRDSAAQLAPLGLTMAQSRILRLVADGPLRMADIAGRMDVVPRTVTPMVDGLAEAGLVDRRADPDDRRSLLVALTPAGRGLLDRLDTARRTSAEQVFGELHQRERKELLLLLGRLCELGGCGICCPGHGGRC
ncbi:MAG TPA: MarR family transcriptional regulator [Acidimicrobiales bacterium]|nr:MarR family transcriptional regulator [Acidimicrobiales bacterium]